MIALSRTKIIIPSFKDRKKPKREKKRNENNRSLFFFLHENKKRRNHMYSRAFKEEAIDYSETHKSVASSFSATAYTTLAGVKTRAQKSRMIGERDSRLWDLIVKNDDICFEHILPRLNQTDLKILVRREYGDEKVD